MCKQYFLGANSCTGFYSLFENFTTEDTVENVYIIKGGPGCGKSSFMRSIASALKDEGLEVEYILCAGDIDSIDGIYIPALKTAYLDGTAPHVLEPRYPGIREAYVNLGIYYAPAAIAPRFDEIKHYTDIYKSCYEKAYNCLEAAEKFQKGIYDKLFTEKTFSTIARRTQGIITRELKKTGRSRGRAVYRFISALCSEGYVCRYDTAYAYCKNLYVIDNDFGLAPHLLNPICQAALSRGYDVIICPSPFIPSVTEHILIPELSLGFVSSCKNSPCTAEQYKHIRLDSLIDKETLRRNRRYYRSQTALRNALMEKAYEYLKNAELIHEEIERIYNPGVDFAGVYALAEAHIKSLLAMRKING